MKIYSIFFLLVASSTAFSQNKLTVIELESRKLELAAKIERLKDSLKIVNHEIADYKTQQMLNDTSLVAINAVTRAHSFMVPDPKLVGEKLLNFENDTEVTVIGYRDNHFKVCVENKCGYIHSSSLRKNDEMNELITKDELKKKNLKSSQYASDFNERLDLKLEENKRMLKKYGQSKFDKMIDGYYWVGMNEEMVIFSLGQPTKKNNTVGSWGTHSQWVYDNGLFIYLENDKLTSFQN